MTGDATGSSSSSINHHQHDHHPTIHVTMTSSQQKEQHLLLDQQASSSSVTLHHVHNNHNNNNKQRRYCRHPDCTRMIKSQGLCQRHGAKPRNCRIKDCTKQAQGNYDGCCKRHFKEMKTNTITQRSHDEPCLPAVPGDSILSMYITTSRTSPSKLKNEDPPPLPSAVRTFHQQHDQKQEMESHSSSQKGTPPSTTNATTTDTAVATATTTTTTTTPLIMNVESSSVYYDRVICTSIAWSPCVGTVMPLVEYLQYGYDYNKPPGWHRNEERSTRGLLPVENLTVPLEEWEKELVCTEILLLTGNPDISFQHLAFAWGKEKGFHSVLADFICEHQVGGGAAGGGVCNDMDDEVEHKKRKRAMDVVVEEEVDVVLNPPPEWDELHSSVGVYNEENLVIDLLSFSPLGARHHQGQPDRNGLNFEDEEEELIFSTSIVEDVLASSDVSISDYTGCASNYATAA